MGRNKNFAILVTETLHEWPAGGRNKDNGESPKGDNAGVSTTGAQEYLVTEPEGWKIHGGEGEARVCESPGRCRMFHDGCGLASPGRWDLEKRKWSRDDFWTGLRKESMEAVLEHCGGQKNLDRMCFEMAAKGESGCGLMKDAELKQKLVDIWSNRLALEGYRADNLQDIAPGQPFRLNLMEALLEMAGDPDHKFLLQGAHGFPVGVIKQLPRTPHMYEEQTTWKLEDDPYMRDEIWRDNYESVGDHEDFVRQHFEEECREGLMEKLSMQQAKERFGDRIAISSLAVLVEEAHGNKENNP